jgi:hypothetical protein
VPFSPWQQIWLAMQQLSPLQPVCPDGQQTPLLQI